MTIDIHQRDRERTFVLRELYFSFFQSFKDSIEAQLNVSSKKDSQDNVNENIEKL